LSHANAKGKGINSKGWVGNQVFRQLGLGKEKRRSEISAIYLQKPVGEFNNRNSLQDDKYYATIIETSTKDILTPPTSVALSLK
jgi:hypothetical protein